MLSEVLHDACLPAGVRAEPFVVVPPVDLVVPAARVIVGEDAVQANGILAWLIGRY